MIKLQRTTRERKKNPPFIFLCVCFWVIWVVFTQKAILNHFPVFFFYRLILDLFVLYCTYDTRCVFFLPPLCLRVDRHYCPYCRVNTCVYHKPAITHVSAHTLRWCFYAAKCLVLLRLWSVNQQLTTMCVETHCGVLMERSLLPLSLI